MQLDIKTIFLIGAGNVGEHLAIALKEKVELVGVFSQNLNSAKFLSEKINIPYFSSIENIPKCDLVLICVSDSAINDVVNQLPEQMNLAYTSGSVDLESLKNRSNLGVFYPLQTFSKGRKISLVEVPFFIESKNKNLEKLLVNLAFKLSNHVKIASSMDRKNLHVGAVIINNFTNHLGLIAKDFVEGKGLDWNDLKPLLAETIDKMIELSPYDAQTGPARRNDASIINEHLNLLHGKPKEIYQLITNSILETYHKND